jgi:hypothetical protein
VDDIELGLEVSLKVFISWSGEKSKVVANKLRNWIPLLLQNVKPWMSEIDIKAGARWNNEIDNELSDTKFGIICVTKTNTEAPWLLFEAGAIAKSVADDTSVCPYLIDLEGPDIPAGPLAKFQAKKSDEKGTYDVLKAINDALGDDARSDDQLNTLFERFWPDLEKVISELPQEEGEQEKMRPADDMIKEILETVRKIAMNQGQGLLSPQLAWLNEGTLAGAAYLNALNQATGIPLPKSSFRSHQGIPDEVYRPDITPGGFGPKKKYKRSEEEEVVDSPTKADE